MPSFLRIFIPLVLAGSPLFAPGQNPPEMSPPTERTLTLAQAEALALKNNPQITIGKLRALAAQQYVREARSALLPNAYVSVTAVAANPGSRIAAGGLNNPALFPRAAVGATVSQLVTDFGRSTSLLSSSEYQAKAEDQNSAVTTAQIVLVVDRAFYNVLEMRDLVTVAQKTVDSRQLLVDKLKPSPMPS
jgi:outer membrane protein